MLQATLQEPCLCFLLVSSKRMKSFQQTAKNHCFSQKRALVDKKVFWWEHFCCPKQRRQVKPQRRGGARLHREANTAGQALIRAPANTVI